MQNTQDFHMTPGEDFVVVECSPHIGDVVIFEYPMPYGVLPRQGRIVEIQDGRVKIKSPAETRGKSRFNWWWTRTVKYFWRPIGEVCVIGGPDEEVEDYWCKHTIPESGSRY